MSQIHDLPPWYWRSLPLEHRIGSRVFDCLFRHSCAIATLLESPYPTPPDQPQLARYSICAGMPRLQQERLQMWTPPVGEILPFLSHLRSPQAERGTWTADSLVNTPEETGFPPPHLPFTGGWLGWLGYDLAWEIEQLPRLNTDPLPFPVSCWYEPECFAVLDHQTQILWLAERQPSHLDVMQHQLEPTEGEIIENNVPEDYQQNSPTPIFQLSQSEYKEIVRK